MRCIVSPEPAQVGHGSSITWPAPPHCGQGWLIEKKPWLSVSMPRPPQRGQTTGIVPGLAPVPLQVLQVDCLGTVTVTSVPSIACSKPRLTSVSRSRPRVGCCGPAPPRRKRVEKMSPMSEAKPPARAAAAAAPKPPNMPPASYCLRFSGSESVS